MAKKPFSHINPATNKVWNRDELFKAFQAEQAKNKNNIIQKLFQKYRLDN